MPQTFKIRTSRTLSVTEVEMPLAKRRALAELYGSPTLYGPLLDLMERACIAFDTALINTSVSDQPGILGAHARSQAAWEFFTYLQKQVQNYHIETTQIEPEPAEQSETDRILSPFDQGEGGADADDESV